MKLIFGILLSVAFSVLVIQNSTELSPNSDVLIKINAKIYKNGFLSFLILEEGKAAKETIFAYSYRNKTTTITSLSSSVVQENHPTEGYMNSEDFHNQLRGGKMAEVICAIDAGFFQLSNQEKLALLNELSK